jgi:PhnB protein
MTNTGLIPELTLSDARGAIEFYKKAFGAKDLGTHATPDGKKIMHGALEINGGVVFVVDDFPERAGGKERSPKALGGSPVTIHLNCVELQTAWKTAVKAGATVLLPLAKQFWGDTYGILEDPFGQRWSMSGARESEKPDVASDEYRSGAKEMYPTAGGAKSKAKSQTKAKAKPKAKAKSQTKAKSKAKR